jgi:hypothetical protein
MAAALCVVFFCAVLYLSLCMCARAHPVETARARSAAERAECDVSCAAAAAADSPLGEHFLDVAATVSASGFALDERPAPRLRKRALFFRAKLEGRTRLALRSSL